MPEPTRREAPSMKVRAAGVVIAVLCVAVAARVNVSIPGSPVPQSLQTLAVLLVGCFLGGRDGTMAMVAYLVAGGAGLPVFADGAAGWAHLVGPTSGYLVGFVLAAGLVGWLSDRGRLGRAGWTFAAMVAGHVVILVLGWGRLGATVGYASALEQGVTPFVLGGLVKSAVGAAVSSATRTIRRRFDEGAPEAGGG